MIPPLRTHFIQTVSQTFDGGDAWLASLPRLLAECADRWQLTIHPPFAALSYNYATPATLPNGTAVVLKLGVPRDELSCEIAALRLYDGQGICHLLDADAERGYLLLERLHPGVMLTKLADDDTATRIAAQLMRRLWTPLPATHTFPTLAKLATGFTKLRTTFGGGTGPFPAQMVDTAVAIFAEHCHNPAEWVLLHGDLHHYNILTAEREAWLAIDPKGVVGPPAFEVGAFLHNPLDLTDWPDWPRRLARRLDIFAEMLEIERPLLLASSFAQDLLSVWWDFEDMGQPPDLRLTSQLWQMMGHDEI